MKRFKKTIFLFLVLSWGIVFSPRISMALEDAIIAVVNDELITLKDLKDYIRSSQISLMAAGKNNREIQEFMVDIQKNGIHKLIEDKLILSKANEIGLDINEKLVDQRMDSIIAQYPSEETFLKALIDNGATISDLRNKIIEQLKIKFVIEHAVKSKIFVNPNEVTDFYNENLNNFKKPARVDLDSIFIPFNDDKAGALKKAQEALDLLQEGKPFADVAAEYSQSPSIGLVEKGQLMPDLENKIFSLRGSALSSLVEVDNGVYIFKLKKRYPEQMSTLEEVSDSIYDLLNHQKFRQKYKEWVDKLKDEAYVEIKK